MNNNIRFDLKQMRAFVAVAESLHFKRAADALFITQPALSRLIKGLEEELGAELFVRTTRQVALTESGRLFLQECRLAFNHIDRAVYLARRAAAGDLGHISVAYNDFAINGVLPALLDRFKEKYPEVGVELVYMPSQDQYKAIKDSLIDIGLLLGPLDIPGIETQRVVLERMVVILPARHPLAKRKSIRLEELRSERFILGSASGWSLFREQAFKLCQQSGFTPNIIQEATTSIGIFGLVAANMGVSIYSECAYRIQREGVAIVPLSDKAAVVETVAAWSEDYESPTTHLFKHLLREDLERQHA